MPRSGHYARSCLGVETSSSRPPETRCARDGGF
jgi:hypothetical protein